MARKFIYVIAALIVLAIAAAFAYRIWGVQIIRWWAVPNTQFQPLPKIAANAYADPKMWIAHPGRATDPARWTPPGFTAATTPTAAVFYIHPTSFLGTARWNAALDDAESNARAELFLRGQASAFNEVGAIWAPRYRQATFGAFLTDITASKQALDLAYGDVLAAFDQFVHEAGDRPIILAGHSQGALHLTGLLRDRIAGKPIAKRIVAAYVIGWPVSRSTDLAALGLPECARADQAGCLLSWQSFAEPADPAMVVDHYNETSGLNGQPRRDTPMVCTNPLTGTPNAVAPATANLGTLVPSADLASATIVAGSVPARCDPQGFLLIGEPPTIGSYVLPGNNYHVYDYGLFWANVRADAARRLAAYSAR
ncbi:DUF3089 domain-containing protein [Sphingomonas sp. PB4P5]|uniref:DUF3089 domain-containing protein n=1 Tax=Parasphingomonas puruogangriensis TaxID=3096155 RepID=UPI002FC8736C